MAFLVFLHLPKFDEEVSCEYRNLPKPVKISVCIAIHGRDLLDPVQDRKNEAYRWLLQSSPFKTVWYTLAEDIMVNSFMDLGISRYKDTFKKKVKPGKTYLLPLINAAFNDELFLSIANHTFTVVEADASNGVYTTDFPNNPLVPFNYTGTPPSNTLVSNDTKVVQLLFITSVELVMQDTSILGAESHPLHLHGFNFFVVGQGFGKFDYKKDPAKFNLVDPVERNTVGVPSDGCVAIRFLADNPGG
ncbi:hypothetical protein HHK36_009065 [Tetracentron sinense]|uniref:Uncharacterized protein n=1 Tax=Tetracentron sinense TaxID=13715 RepID=A0A834ZA17_TETSI|nr:hypothetical protein HHK36_009065 [Tetracentron sinense]